jgi:hypothetical protein
MGEKTAAGQLLVRNATIMGTSQAGLQVEGLAADHIQIRLEHVRFINTATAYTGPCVGALPVPPLKCNGSASLSPIVFGDPEHGNIVEDFFVGTVAFGPGCVVEDTMDRPFATFIAGNGSLSHGRLCHSDTALYISLVVLYTKYTGWCQNDFYVHA